MPALFSPAGRFARGILMTMRLRLAFVALVFLFSATAFGHDANWWYEKYQKLGHADPKWDSFVREGIDHWEKAGDAKTDDGVKAELVLSVKALEKAYAAGCRCPIALYIDARNIAQITAAGTTVFDRFNESLARAGEKPELTFLRIYCSNALACRYMGSNEFKEAIPYFQMALSLSSPDVEEDILKEAKTGLQQAKEKLAASQEQSGRLTAIVLPPHPTKEQARAYVREILFLAAKKANWRRNDPEFAMLEKVGPENLDVLLEALGANGGQSWVPDYYVKATLTRLARPEHKALLLKWLPLREDLVEIMQRKGWVQDMRPFLVSRIAERAKDTNLGVLQAAAALRDPATYADLVWHFENNQNGPNIYDDLKNLPGIQLKDAVLHLWAASKSWTDWRASRRFWLAFAAMDYGVTEALEFAVGKLESPEVAGWYRGPETLREAIRQRTGLRGSNEDIRAWFQANKGKLVFDENKRMFQPNP